MPYRHDSEIYHLRRACEHNHNNHVDTHSVLILQVPML